MCYYTYAYLRKDGTPYYIGKGKGNRAYRFSGRTVKAPKDRGMILILKQDLTEDEAFRHEIYMIDILGRKDLGTGVLRNLTRGGEGASGLSDETKRKIGESQKKRLASEEARKKISESNARRIISDETRKKLSRAATVREERKKASCRQASLVSPYDEEHQPEAML